MKNKTWMRLQQVLQQHQQYAAVKREKTHENLRKIERVLNRIFSSMKLRAPRFGFDNMSPRSLYEVKSAWEIDLLCAVKYLDPSEVVLDENQVPPGSARVCPATKSALENWQDLCGRAVSGQESIGAEMLVAELSKELKAAVDSLKDQEEFGPEVADVCAHSTRQQATLAVTLASGDNIRVNVLPVIQLRGLWPLCAHDFKKQMTRLPLADRFRVEDSCGVLLVAKPVQSCSEFLWRLWFSEVERVLLRAQKQCCTAFCMRVLSDLDHVHLSHGNLLNRYHLQTLLLHEYLKYPAAKDWVQERLPQRIMGLLSSLKRMFSERSCPHVFLNDVNLLARCDAAVARGLEKKISAIVKDPVSFIHPGGMCVKDGGSVNVTCDLLVNTMSSRVQININLQSS